METTAAPEIAEAIESLIEASTSARSSKGFRRWTDEENAATAELIARATRINVSRFKPL